MSQEPKYTASQLATTAEILGPSITEEQTNLIMDHAKDLSIADREWISSYVSGPVYTAMREHEAEMGGFARY